MGNRMANVVIYVMAKQNVEAKKDEVLLGEAASIYCENSAIRARASKLRIHKFREGQESRVVISMMKIIEAMAMKMIKTVSHINMPKMFACPAPLHLCTPMVLAR